IPIDSSSSTNHGQLRSSITVAIAGSNGYVKTTPRSALAYAGPAYLASAAIAAPLDCNDQDSFYSHTFASGA
ncbi:hypothetical protein K432DRAFT_312358, partial [Lepidopterella palustris CBS 459.81]